MRTNKTTHTKQGLLWAGLVAFALSYLVFSTAGTVQANIKKTVVRTSVPISTSFIYGGNMLSYEEPVLAILRRSLYDVDSYSIILFDADPATRTHSYLVLKNIDGEIEEELTPEYTVSEAFFNEHAEHVGMTIAAKNEEGQYTDIASPAGYYNFVDNDDYGQWEDGDDGGQVWQFNERHAFLLVMLGYTHNLHMKRQRYSDYQRHHRSGKAYYGRSNNLTSNDTYYGTRGRVSKRFYSQNPVTKRQTFKERVRERVQRSSVQNSRVGRNGTRVKSGSRLNSSRTGSSQRKSLSPSRRTSRGKSITPSKRNSNGRKSLTPSKRNSNGRKSITPSKRTKRKQIGSSTRRSSSSSRISKSNSRYNSTSSSRSRGGGYGK